MKKAIATVARLLTMACALALCLEIHAQQGVKPVSGVVTDVSGEPIPGVNVLEKGTTNGTITDLDGQYSLTCQPKATLVFSFVGYSTKEIAVSNQSKLNVQLSEDNQALDEVVVIGYGTAKKKDLTGAISTLKAENIEKEIPKSVQDILRAGAAGLYVGMSTDVDGSASLQIRGKNTLTAGSEPLLVVDGVIYNGALQDINPMDIESVDVLKDASSAAVYGAKAASGVIAITTKKGKMSLSKRPTITFNANVGFTTPANLPKKVDGTGFLALRQAYEEGTKTDEEMAKTPGYYSDPRISGVDPLAWYNYDMQTPISVLPSQDELVSKWLTRLELRDIEIQNYLAGRETDWDDEIFQTGFQQDYTVGIQNRTDRTSYYWSLGYANRDGQIIGAHFENFRSRLNLDCKITDFLSVGTNLQFSNRRGGELKADTDQRLNLSPYSELTTDRTSVYAQYPNGDPTASTHPMWDNYFRDRDELTTRLTASGYAKITLPFGIIFTSTFSPDMQWYHYYNHESSENPTWAATGGSSERKETHRYNWQIDNVLRWQYQFDGGHNVELTLLQNAEKKQYWETDDTGKNFSPSDVLGYHKTGAATVPTISSNDTYSTGDALMARAFYSYQGRYMLTASIRRDGYSAFGINNPRATFPSVALGWVFSEEKFMKSIEDVFSYGKLRLSWGINGNNDIGQYEALAQLNASLTPYISVNGTPYIGSQIYINHMGNQNLKWERTQAYNIGLDLAFFNSRLRATVEGYVSKTNDLLVSRSLPKITGYENVKDNLGRLRNYGMEISLEGDPIVQKNFKWTSSANFSFNRRKILSLYGNMVNDYDEAGNVIGQHEADDTTNGWYIGHDPNELYDYEMDGVWQLGEEAEAAKYGLQPGDFKYVDQNGDGQLNTADKIFYDKYTTPRFYVNWRNQFTLFKDFTLSFLLYARLGQWNTFNKAANITSLLDRHSGLDLERWTKDNPTNKYARVQSTNKGNHYVNKSFMRMDNISLSYNVPNKLTNKFCVNDMRVTLNVRNPFVVSSFESGDPEGGDYTSRSYALGINFSL